MNDLSIYKGEDFALIINAVTDDGSAPEDLSEFDITAQISTTPLGAKIIASTKDGYQILIVRKENSVVTMNISNALTSRLSEGMITLTIQLQHKQTKVQLIAESTLIEVKQSKLTNRIA